MDQNILTSFYPEIFLSFFILIQLFSNALISTNIKYNYPILNKEIFFQCFFVLICLIFLTFNNSIEGYFSNFLFLNDFSCKVIKLLFLFICILALIPIFRSFISQSLNFSEYFILFLISILSLMLLINSSDMLSAYLLLEMQALSFYALACFRRRSVFSTEASLKYFIFGSFFSGIFLFGCSILFGITGTLNFNNLGLVLSIPFSLEVFRVENIFLSLSILLITFFFLFKIAAFPFHFWSPDVYEGSPLASTIIFSVIPKTAVIFFFVKWLCLIGLFKEIKILLLFSGVGSTLIGALFALRQKRIKRLLIYSSISQTGFLVAGLSSFNLETISSVFFFLIVYIFTSILIWTIISLLFSFQNKINIYENKQKPFPLYLSSLSSFFAINQVWSLSNIFIFFSLAGIPPSIGFFAKFFIIYSLVADGNLLHSFFLLIISSISVFYYLRIIKLIFFEKRLLSKINYSQVIFDDFLFSFECLFISFYLFLIVFFFFFPSFLIYLSNIIIYCMFFF
jgi:NADH-quinone oxidoreductase subunit N